MRSTTTSVPDVIREVITRNRSIYDCMKMDIINYTALAVKIQKEVESILRAPVNLNTIVVAIKRYADSFTEKEEVREQPVLKNARLSLKDGIINVKLSIRGPKALDAASLMNKFAQIDPGHDFFRMSDTFRVLTEDLSDVRSLLDSLGGEKNVFQTGLAKINIRVPEAHRRSDVVSYVTEILHSNGIELENAFFGVDDIVIVLQRKNAARAYELLRSEISR
ncbi:MAG: hypothetical protein NPMRIOTA_10003 [Nitrosopumilales archaeon]|nr:MAG: hypothetical protein NPMRIOTA_10003 [Nitrosopumilales archaeon]